MRFIILLLAVFIQFTAMAQNAVVTGKITNPKGEKVKLYYNKGAAVYEFNKVEKEATLDKKGKFKIELPLDAPAEVTLAHGDEVTQMFLEPGDEVSISLDTEQFDESIKYTGKSAANNIFIAKYFLAFIDGGQEKAQAKYNRLANAPTGNYMGFLDSLQSAKVKFYEQSKTGLSAAFKNYFTNQLVYEAANEKLNYPDFKEYYTRKKTELPADYYQFLKDVKIQNDSALMMSAYLNFLDNYLFYQVQRLANESQIREYKFTNAKYALADLYFKGKTRDVMLAQVAHNGVSQLPFAEGEKLYNNFKAEVKDKDLVSFVTQKYDRKKLLAEGAAAPTFTLKDTSGKTVSLQDFKGKIVYMDFWASWCGPCMREAPYAVKLQEQFAGKDIVFLYVSTDEDDESWKKAIRTKNLQKGVHLISKKSAENVQDKYDVDGIPSYFLIGRDGKIINGNASRPSSEETVEMLNKALSQK